MKLLILTALSLSLAACCPPQLIVKEPVEVKVPVPVPCQIQPPQKPIWQLDYPAVRSAGLFVKGNSALIELEQRRQYERELEAALSACIDSMPPAAH